MDLATLVTGVMPLVQLVAGALVGCCVAMR